MFQITETFIGIKITLTFSSEKEYKHPMSVFDIKIENQKGDSFCCSRTTFNFVGELKRRDFYFDDAISHICDSTEYMSFEDYHGVDGVVDYSNNSKEELDEAYKEQQDIRQGIINVVGEDWITMMGCYLALK
jgi:hypothetical protein